ncbi:hypothetical protein [Silanimonas lenta]|uniref:hypothetical protein n=1 Tax=Silanimonas lenta TaxID=265429 RepID=UPI0021DEF673|nr:MAG: hypothetical protein KatS3mg128_0066 [Silanimonas sp.]
MSHFSPRTRAEALRDLDYAIRVGVVHERLFGRMHRLFRLIQLLGSSAAFAGVVGGNAALSASFALLVAAVAFLDIAFDPAVAARRHADLVRALSRAKSEALENPGKTVDAIDQARAAASDIEGLTLFESLRVPCYNEVQRRHGLEANVRPLTRWQRFMQAIA